MTAVPETAGRVVYEPTSSRQGFLLVAPGLVAVLGGACVPTVLRRVWAEMSSPSPSLEKVVESIPLLGPDGVASFAVAALEGGGAHPLLVSVVARGDSVVDLYSAERPSRRFSSQGLQPWHLASFAQVVGIRFASGASTHPVADAPTVSGAELPLVFGAASASSVLWMLDDRLAVVDEGARGGLPGPPSGETGRNEDEITLERVPERRRARHGGPSEAANLPASKPIRARPCRVRIGSQAPFELHVPVYIGRRPRGPRQTGADQVMLVEVPSPTREVSASHILVEQRVGEVVVTDLKSTNGTAVTLPGSPRINLRQGDSIVLPPYSRIDIGDGTVIEILPGAD